MLAEDGLCKTFDAKADGYTRSDGAGLVILKRLSDAKQNGDNILDIKSLKTDIKKNLNKLLDKLSGKQQDSSKKESIDHKKTIKNLKDLF